MKRILFAGLLLFGIAENAGAALTVNPSSTGTNTSTYDAFGQIICKGGENYGKTCTSGTILSIYRAGSSHVGATDSGVIALREFDIPSRSWSSTVRTIYSESGVDFRDPHGGYIGDRLFIFSKRRTTSNGAAIDFGYIYSDDDGATWSTWNTVTFEFVADEDGNASSGGLTPTDDPDTFLQPIFHANDALANTWNVGYIITTDGGATWTADDDAIFAEATGADKWGETSIAYCGNGRLIALIRENDGDFVGQSVSTDNGTTWSTLTDRTNLGTSSLVKVPFAYYDQETNRLFAVYMDRSGGGALKLSWTYSDYPFEDADNWEATVNLDTGYTANGYPSIVKIDSDEYLIVSSHEASASDADIDWMIYQVTDLSDPVKLQ